MTGFSVTTRDGQSIAARELGRADGPVLTLVHSLAMSADFWNRATPHLADQFRIITLDCRGHGASARAPGPYSVQTMANDIADVLDAVGVERTIIAGCSMGGCVALAFALAYPERTRALGLIDTTAWYGETAPSDWAQRGRQGVEKGLASLVGFQTTRWFSDRFREENSQLVQGMVDVFVANDPACYLASCEMLGAADLRPGLKDIDMPTAVIVGEEDYATPVAMAEATAGAIMGATLEVIAGGRHLTPVECPERIARFLRALADR